MIHHDIPEDLLRRSGIDPAEGSHAMNDDYRHNGHNPSIEIEAIRASSVQTKPVTWLWHGRIPEGKLTIFDGDPDLGKSVVTLEGV